jgi:wyosine [tRNA(Phe)-imidazoG37] synthetase (radical SAM superfamily)
MPLPPLEHIVYGPVRSRRLGRSLGVNLLPAGMKVCNMDCAYCQYGWTRGARRAASRGRGWQDVDQVEAALERRLREAAQRNELLDRLTVAGHGEPTLHPAFGEIAERLRAVRDRMTPGVRLAILSNSTTAAWPDVGRGLAVFDERYMKLDAGDPITFARINRAGGTAGESVADIIDALGALSSVVVQAMFVSDAACRVDNATDGAVHEWLSAIERVRPTRVHIYTIDRAPADDTLKPVGARRLREIAERVRAAGIPADVFPARHDHR